MAVASVQDRPVTFECRPWEVKLLLRLRQMRERRAVSHVLIDITSMRLFPVGGAEVLDSQLHSTVK
jgi:hypothetical protein